MEIRNNISQPAFQANVDIHLASELRKDAARISTSLLERFDNQLSLVSKWGDKASEISESIDFSTGAGRLVLNNENLSSSYGGRLPMAEDNSLLTSFLNLRKKDILNAEQELAERVMNNKLELIHKAIQDKSLVERITGKINPTDEEFAMAVDKMSEEQVTNLRFNLDTQPVETGNLLDFVG